jgi:hypothetical protein
MKHGATHKVCNLSGKNGLLPGAILVPYWLDSCADSCTEHIDIWFLPGVMLWEGAPCIPSQHDNQVQKIKSINNHHDFPCLTTVFQQLDCGAGEKKRWSQVRSSSYLAKNLGPKCDVIGPDCYKIALYIYITTHNYT